MKIMDFNRIRVKELKEQDPNLKSIPKEAGIYRWWFPQELAEILLSSLKGIDLDLINKEEINHKEYWCLYFGIAKNLRQRIHWHACQNHTTSTVKRGFLSTLRQSVSSLMKLDQTTSTDKVNDILEQCYWDWKTTDTKDTAKNIEKTELSNGYFPLNVQDNKSVPPSVLAQLKELRKRHKK